MKYKIVLINLVLLILSILCLYFAVNAYFLKYSILLLSFSLFLTICLSLKIFILKEKNIDNKLIFIINSINCFLSAVFIISSICACISKFFAYAHLNTTVFGIVITSILLLSFSLAILIFKYAKYIKEFVFLLPKDGYKIKLQNFFLILIFSLFSLTFLGLFLCCNFLYIFAIIGVLFLIVGSIFTFYLSISKKYVIIKKRQYVLDLSGFIFSLLVFTVIFACLVVGLYAFAPVFWGSTPYFLQNYSLCVWAMVGLIIGSFTYLLYLVSVIILFVKLHKSRINFNR